VRPLSRYERRASESHFSRGRKKRVGKHRIDVCQERNGNLKQGKSGHLSHDPRKQEIEWTWALKVRNLVQVI
jgi:hypothetical protein